MVAAVSWTIFFKVFSLAFIFGSQNIISPPYLCTLSTLNFGLLSGIITLILAPSLLAADETAAPWFPDDVVMTPFVNCFFESCKIVFVAPLILNEPVFWKLSHLKNMLVFVSVFIFSHVSIGVLWIKFEILLC